MISHIVRGYHQTVKISCCKIAVAPIAHIVGCWTTLSQAHSNDLPKVPKDSWRTITTHYSEGRGHFPMIRVAKCITWCHGKVHTHFMNFGVYRHYMNIWKRQVNLKGKAFLPEVAVLQGTYWVYRILSFVVIARLKVVHFNSTHQVCQNKQVH